ncbi:MAG TPA: peptidylprolyl isomerase [Steroidobacteraceae bacterium]|nr:peptidylprolyl isomerase [Steroidobacteraceae bacterium]
MHKFKTALLIASLAALSAACTKPAPNAAKPADTAATAPKATVVATVNGKDINSVMFDTFLQAVASKPASEVPEEQKKDLLDRLIDMSIAAQAAEKDGLDNDTQLKARLELLHMQLLAEAESEKYFKTHPISDSELKAEYDAQVAQMPKEFKARHILVEKKEVAEDIIKKLQGGADFAKIAKEQSKDPGSAKAGGELGWFNANSMVKPFSDALGGLQKGETTKAPVQTQYGWHVIQLEDTRTPEPPQFDAVKKQVEMLAQRKKLQAYIEQLRKSAQIQKKS